MTTQVCSRCGAPDDRHSMKCLQAMALGWAMGVEPRPQRFEGSRAGVGAPSPAANAVPEVVEQLREQLARAEAQERLWRERVRTWQHDYGVLRQSYEDLQAGRSATQQLAEGMGVPVTAEQDVKFPFTALPPEYHDANLAGKRRAEREREIDAEIQAQLIAEAEASPDLDVVEHDGAVSIYPKTPHEPGGIVSVEADADGDPVVSIREDGPLGEVADDTATQTTKPDRPLPTFDPATNATRVAEPATAAPKPPSFGGDSPAHDSIRRWVQGNIVLADSPPRTDDNGRLFDPGYITSPELVAAFEEWAARTGAPTDKRTARLVGVELRKVAPVVRQAPVIDGKKPMAYFGIVVADQAQKAPVPDAEPEAPRPLTKAEINRRSVEEVRRLIDEAKDRAAAAHQVADEVQEQEAEAEVAVLEEEERTWGTAPRGRGSVGTLTLAEVQAENAAVMENTARDRADAAERPGDEKMSALARDMINALLDLNCGFTYAPNKGSTKAYIRDPEGGRYPVSTSYSGGKAKVSELRQLRRYLNRKGYLPTAGSPISLLTLPGKKAVPAALAPVPVTVVSADGKVRTVEEVGDAEEAASAPPLTEDQMDRALFDTYSDCRAGLPLTLPYTLTADVKALEHYPEEAIDACVRNPEQVEVRPESKTKGYPVLKFRRGDVNVVMGFRNRTHPAVMRAEWGNLLAHDTYHVARHGGGGSRGSTGLPSGPAALKSRLRQMGAEITNETAKTATVTYQGQDLGQITVEKCPRATTHNDFQRMQRKIHAIDQREETAV